MGDIEGDHLIEAIDAANRLSDYARSISGIAEDLSRVGLDKPANALGWFADDIEKQAKAVRDNCSKALRGAARDAEQSALNMMSGMLAVARVKEETEKS